MVCSQNLVEDGIVIDNFDKQYRETAQHFFLTHAHFDHMKGLSKTFKHGKIYCTNTTFNLVVAIYPDINKSVFKIIDYRKPFSVGKWTVTARKAYHCDGSAMFIFQSENKTILYTGDFRFNPEMCDDAPEVDIAYYDDTFEKIDYSVPSIFSTYENFETVLRQLLEKNSDDVWINMSMLGVEPYLRRFSDMNDVKYRLSDSLVGTYKERQIRYLLANRVGGKSRIVLGHRNKDKDVPMIIFSCSHFIFKNKPKKGYHYVFFSVHPDISEIDLLFKCFKVKISNPCELNIYKNTRSHNVK